eukprot:2581726-Pleurochrysis_carterae.AAC.1
MVSHSIPNRERNAAIPSGRLNGPEKSNRTRRERAAAPTTWSAVRTSCGEEICRDLVGFREAQWFGWQGRLRRNSGGANSAS